MARTLLPPTLLVYLDVQPETAYERMRRRSRGCEGGVSLSYLQDLKVGYERLLSDAERGLLPWARSVKTVVVPWDPDVVSEAQWSAVAKTLKNGSGSSTPS